jgi:hypothetical protein
MSLPRAGVRSDFRRFEELHDKCDKVDTALTAFKLSSTLQLGDLQRLETIATNLVDAINELLMQIKEKTSYGVVSGLEVTEQDEPDMTVNVAEGTIYMQNGDRFEVDTDVITVDTADTTNARKDIIYVSSTGEITYLAGTAAEVPEAPSTPTGGLILAEIAVAANATAIETANITDKRKPIATNLVDAINELLTQIKEKTSYGVVSGLEVTAQETPDMSVNVSEGIIYMQDGERFEVEADTMNVMEADADNPRIDIIYINGTGVVSYYPGTAAAEPTAPETPLSSQLLAEIAVAKNATAIEKANITDKRKLIVS